MINSINNNNNIADFYNFANNYIVLLLFLALLAAACPESAPFMADECLMAIPEIEGIDYTTKEYLKFVNHIQAAVERLNKNSDGFKWSPHKVELAIWTHYIVSDLKPELLSSKYLICKIIEFIRIALRTPIDYILLSTASTRKFYNTALLIPS